jgi:DNA-binding CsgD family transcriptional regulator
MELLSRRDGAAAAVALYDDICAVLVPLWSETFGARLRLAALAVAALADEAPRTPSAGRAAVRATAARLVADAGRVLAARSGDEDDHPSRHAVERPFGLEGRAWEARLRAEELRLAWLLGDPVDLPRMVGRWHQAAARFAELDHPFEEARARTRLSAVLRASGDTEGRQEEAAVARRLARRLGSTPLLEEVGAARSGATDTLTPREREVLALVAAGRSNPDIGAQLFISGKTVSVHVSNVMAKLGAGSRTEAAALARRAGLLD